MCLSVFQHISTEAWQLLYLYYENVNNIPVTMLVENNQLRYHLMSRRKSGLVKEGFSYTPSEPVHAAFGSTS